MAILEQYIAFDLETTGIDPQKAEIIELAAVRVRGGRVVGEFQTLIRPRRRLPHHIERLTGISARDLRGQPPVEDALPRFREFVGDLPLIAHNAAFDVGFLLAAGAKDWLPPVYDTLELARIALPRLRNHKLETLLNAFGIERGVHHRAGADTHALAKLVVALVDTLAARPFNRLEALVALAEEARQSEPPMGSIAELLREIVELAARRGVAQAKAPPLDEAYLVALPNMLGEFSGARLEPEPVMQEVDPGVVEGLLGPDGPLAAAMERYEVRPSQVEMARAVTQAINDGEVLVCEAGTGTGKSVAYLVPALLWALANGRRIVVSTNTKNLQEQLFYKDLPLLARALGVPFRAVLLKGRNNYICLNRWRAGKVPGLSITTERERNAALPIATWIAETGSGDISENVAFPQTGPGRSLWAKLSAEGQPCTPTACRCYAECFVTHIRRAAQQAHVVVVNHSLLFSDLVAENMILGEYEDLIIDEAHNLERVASQYLGMELSWWTVRDLANRIYLREAGESGLLARIKDELPKGLLAQDAVKTYQTQVSRGCDAVGEMTRAGQAFFERLKAVLGQPPTPSRFAYKARYTAAENVFANAAEERDALRASLEHLSDELATLADWVRELEPGKLPSRDEFVADLENRCADLEELADTINDLTEADDEELVYWYEMPQDGDGSAVRLFAAPLHVGSRLREQFFPSLRSVVMTSATLAVAGKFTYFLDRTGLSNGDISERVRTLSVGSPFDYERQAIVAVPGWFPNPKSPGFQDAVTELLREVILRVRRGTLVLFTSYKMLNDTYRAVRDELVSNSVLLLGQGLDGSRSNIADIFRQERESVLFGTESFWQGVDMPGEALEMLIIVKLPFSVPTEPLAIAQGEELRRAGKDPFLHLSVPEAAIRFRQGFGRLIRTQQDRGAVLILDTRVITERFGRAFLLSLPTAHRVFKTSEQLLDTLAHWFEPSP